VIEVPYGTKIEKAEFVFSREFMFFEHNYLCAVCKKFSAVQDTHTGVLQPCWTCQKYFTQIKKKTMLDKALNWLTSYSW